LIKLEFSRNIVRKLPQYKTSRKSIHREPSSIRTDRLTKERNGRQAHDETNSPFLQICASASVVVVVVVVVVAAAAVAVAVAVAVVAVGGGVIFIFLCCNYNVPYGCSCQMRYYYYCYYYMSPLQLTYFVAVCVVIFIVTNLSELHNITL